MKKTHLVIAIIIVVLLGLGAFVASQLSDGMTATNPTPTAPTNEAVLPVEPDGGIGDGATPIGEEQAGTSPRSSLATTAGGNDVVAYHFGTGEREVLFVTGVHGAYSWATAELGYEMVDYFTANPTIIPANVRVTIIPALNPDGLTDISTGEGINRAVALGLSDTVKTAARFNSNTVDLNRNFDCEWAASGTWQNRTVSGGSAPFSEPETAALRDYVRAHDPVAAVVWFSQEGKVYPSACGGNPSNASITLAANFASAASYPTETTFDAYAITGDMVNWMAKEGIPAISVLLSSHTDTEWDKNRAGVIAVLNNTAN